MSHTGATAHEAVERSTIGSGKERAAGLRSNVACGSCRLRKVRCSFATTGRPCINCQHDGVVCEILPRKQKGAKRKHPWRSPDATATAESEQVIATPESSAFRREVHPVKGQNQSSEGHHSPSAAPSPSQPATGSGTDFTIAFDSHAYTHPGGNRDMLYFGDQQAINGMLVTLPTPTSPSSRYFAPAESGGSHSAEDLEYFRAKGCFSLPSQQVCGQLLTCYFEYVHPIVPVVDPAHILRVFDNGTDLHTSLLIFWSMFSAAASLVEPSVIAKAGYSTRKEMRSAMYRRAKYLFDGDFEKNKVAYIQSAVLLSFFYTDTTDRTGAWHWLGTAISLCHSLGLHRRIERLVPENHFTNDRLRLFRRIWWTCVVRDRWLSLGQGRPMRIQLDFCDAPMPTIEDVTLDLQYLPEHLRVTYLSADQTVLAGLWVSLVQVSKVLGDVIHAFYGFKKSATAVKSVNELDDQLASTEFSASDASPDRRVDVQRYVLKQFHGAARIVLYRPFLRQKFHQAAQDTEPSLRAQARTIVNAAAQQIHSALERLIEMDAVGLLQPLSLTAIMPAMQIYLMETKHSTRSLQRTVSSQKLHLFMMVLAEMRENYWGADAILRLFQAAEAAMYDEIELQHSVATQHTFEDGAGAPPKSETSGVARFETCGATAAFASKTQSCSTQMPLDGFPIDLYSGDLLDWSASEFLADIQESDFLAHQGNTRLDAWPEF